ncbi:MAG: hypothetical protein ACRD5Z_08140, partial [Bryobacteraceae bacterium]
RVVSSPCTNTCVPGTDYTKEFTRDYFFQLNQYWLREYHIDGFRYDYVPGMYDGPIGQGYANLVYRTYQDSKALAKFDAGNGRSKIIQCAEHLPDPAGIMSQTYLKLRVAKRTPRSRA